MGAADREKDQAQRPRPAWSRASGMRCRKGLEGLGEMVAGVKWKAGREGEKTVSLDGDGLGLGVMPPAAELSAGLRRSILEGEGGEVSAAAIPGPLPAGWLYNGLSFSGSMSSTLSRTRW